MAKAYRVGVIAATGEVSYDAGWVPGFRIWNEQNLWLWRIPIRVD